MKSSRDYEYAILRCTLLQVDKWTAIGPQAPYSSSAIDVFSFVSSMLDVFAAYLAQVMPFGVEALPRFFTVVNEVRG